MSERIIRNSALNKTNILAKHAVFGKQQPKHRLLQLTCDNLKSRAGFAQTLDSSCHRLDGVGVSTLQFIQDTAAVGGGAAGRRVSPVGGGVDRDAHGILVLIPRDRGVVGDTVQGVVLDHWRAGGWAGDCHTSQICLLEESFG